MIQEREQVILLIGIYSLLKLLASFSFAYFGYKLILAMKETGVKELQTRLLIAGSASFVIGVVFLVCAFTQGVGPESKSQPRDEKIKTIVSKVIINGEKPTAGEAAIVRAWAGTSVP